MQVNSLLSDSYNFVNTSSWSILFYQPCLDDEWEDNLSSDLASYS